MNRVYLVVVSFLIALLIFGTFFEIITPSQKSADGKGNVATTNPIESILGGNPQKDTDENLSLSQTVTQEREIRACRDAIKGFSNQAQIEKQACRKNIEDKYRLKKEQEIIMDSLKESTLLTKTQKSKTLQTKKSSIALINAFRNASAFIIFIYLTLLLTLWIQLFIAFVVKDRLSNKQETLIEWNINVPPILGVVGTIYSFASFTLVAEQQKGLFDIFKNNFYDAATTTVIGGSFYVINFAIAVWIASKIPKEG